MLSKKNKWKYTKFSRVLITFKKVEKIKNKKNVILYDTRVRDSYDKGHIRLSIHISALKIKNVISKISKKNIIILIGNEERSNASIASWARFEGYKKVKILKGGINNLPKKCLKVISKKKK